MIILCIFNGIVFIASFILNIWISSIRNTVENSGDELMNELLEKDIEERTAELAINSLATKLKTWTYGLYIQNDCPQKFRIAVFESCNRIQK